MGLFSRLSGKQPERKATDDVLLMHSMLCMAGAYGVLESSELASVEAFYITLPEFRGKDFGGLIEQSQKIVTKHSNVRESLKELPNIENPTIRNKAFILAVDIAPASGDVDESEDQMLEAMQRILGIDDGMAAKTIEVLSAKYAS